MGDIMSVHYSDPKLKVFALSSNRPLAKKIADEVGVELGDVSVTKFSDGEIRIKIEESIRGEHVYLIQSTSEPSNDNLMVNIYMINTQCNASYITTNIVHTMYGTALCVH